MHVGIVICDVVYVIQIDKANTYRDEV